MVNIELEPELDTCVETEAKRQYEQIQRELLKGGEEKGLTKRLEVLRLFLESADFSKLRSESEKHLVEGKRVKFLLSLEKGKPKCEMRIV